MAKVYKLKGSYCSIIDYSIEQKGKKLVYLSKMLETIAKGRDRFWYWQKGSFGSCMMDYCITSYTIMI